MKTFLLHIDDGEGLAARLDVARALAEKYKSHVTACYCTPTAYNHAFFASGYMVSADVASALDASWAELAEKRKTEFMRGWPEAGPTADWHEVRNSADIALPDQMRLADITLVGLPDSQPVRDQQVGLLGDIVLLTGLPVLTLPQGCKAPLGHGPALVAWDGSLEASHAVRAALPFLKSATKVFVAEIHEDTPKELPAADIAPYLARHGLKVEVIQRPAAKRISSEILAIAGEVGAELIVAGAYGHMRLREMVFGGVTRQLMENATMPVLFCH